MNRELRSPSPAVGIDGAPEGPRRATAGGALARLRAATASHHRDLEEDTLLQALTSPTLSMPQYGEVLHRFHGFHQPLEPAMEQYLQPVLNEAERVARRRIPLLEQDLRSGFFPEYRPETPPAAPSLPDSTAAALGCLYVIEGSTLGGQLICRNIRSTLGERAPVAYFNSYGREVGAKWRATCQLIEANVTSEDHFTAACAAAVATFTALGACFKV